MKAKVLTVVLAGLLGACSMPMMQIDASFAQVAEYYLVTGRQGLMLKQQIRFADVETSKIDRDWNSTTTVEVLGVSSQKRRTGYRFSVLQNGENTARVDCSSGGDMSQVDVSSVFGKNTSMVLDAVDFLQCSLLKWGETKNWQLDLIQSYDGKEMRGVLRPAVYSNAPAPYEILGVSEIEGFDWALGEQVGFEVFKQGRQLMAVQLMGNGAVWLAPDLNADERRFMTSLALAMLAYQKVE
ncbi:hypothetical protein IB286_08865 [Spongiibacter sp. KMU-158]|uniref:Lipoprotein n=1 Tax=Spongiibacter pelagi TaxID=2760804 RepID=A0A927C464_9GAMM|nr:hypothetical protein [Spongiibacter pelagi]MBD2859120.1 hypothetical protein [Spongiibacter pelagi]